MSTTFGQLELKPAPKGEILVGKHHKLLAPKINPSDESLPRRLPSPRTNQEGQQLGQVTPHQFAFINTTDGVQYSGQGSKSVVRSHVMRNFHRQKKKSRMKQADLDSPENSKSFPSIDQRLGQANPYSSMDGDNPWLHREDNKAVKSLINSSKENEPGKNSALVLQRQRHDEGGELLMSNLWPLPVDAHATELIYHYIQTFAKNFVPMKQSWESEWFKSTLSDPACFHGTLFLSAAHKALLTGSENSLPMECFQHKGEVIRIIKTRLSDPKKRVMDGTIAAIACLAAFETLGGIASDATVHVDGLEKLVGMRGGLKQLGMDGFLEQLLYWVDLSNATATKEKPHFLPLQAPVYSNYSELEDLWKYCESQWSKELLIDLPMKSYEGLDVLETRLFHRLRQLTILAASDPLWTSGPKQQAYASAVLLLERQIGVAVQQRVAFRRRVGVITFTPPRCILYIPCLVFCYMILRLTPVRCSIYDPLVLRMKTYIDRMTPGQLFERFSREFWFWALLFVGAASMGRSQLAYFKRITEQLCKLLHIHSWEEAKTTLQDFAWVDSICERHCKPFWDTLEDI